MEASPYLLLGNKVRLRHASLPVDSCSHYERPLSGQSEEKNSPEFWLNSPPQLVSPEDFIP